ncbi:ATP synthase F1 subunit delta [Chlorogloeopsis fritschii PCC 9212]|uniref:ATP synthase subunit delta n=1 Tax=Chlorogloeopsis fritschii PCC 6912 TaxID=211165 RepID=A0A433MZ89_CHLFR|nr:ATP synthase F1 subunit delta [Chlorogloeopsis fritschii]RUR73780.1 ATP synthase subunit delta [Chlorogloeopsis fritschii PCC 6912]
MRHGIVSTKIVKPYAQALMSIAVNHGLTERINQDVAFLLDLLDKSQDLNQFLANPLVKAEAKKAVLRKIAATQVHPYVLNFLMLLVDRRRILWLQGICQEYQLLLRELNQIVLAEAIATIELTEKQRQAIAEKIKEMTGAKQVELKTRIDPNILGGLVVKVGSQVIDLSLKEQLRRLANSLMK